MDKIAVLCVLKSGGDYDVTYVEKLRNMVARNVTIPYRFVCLTDMPVSCCQTISLKDNLPGWWSKIELFRPGLVSADRIIYFDLDTIIVGNIDEFLLEDGGFVALGNLHPFRKRNPFGSGMMAWDNNKKYSFLYSKYNVILHKGFRGDQDYIKVMLDGDGKEITYWQKKHKGVYSYKYNCLNGLPQDAKIVCFHGRPRPIGVKKVKWIQDNWQ